MKLLSAIKFLLMSHKDTQNHGISTQSTEPKFVFVFNIVYRMAIPLKNPSIATMEGG